MPERNSNIAEWFYIPSWEQAPIANASSGAAAGNLSSLIFVDESGCGSRLAELLQKSGQRATTVRAGASFQRINENSFVINDETPENYLQLWKELTASRRIPGTIVHLRCLTRGDRGLSPEDSCDFVRSKGFNSLLYLTQAIGDQTFGEPIELKVVSDDLHKVTGRETLSPSKGLLLGPCRVIRKEFTNIHCANVDFAEGLTVEDCAQVLLKEISVQSAEAVVAYRDSVRWVQAIEHAPLPQVNPAHSVLRQGGVYLITGGLGGIGLVLAEYLAQAVRARLILTSRSQLPGRAQWLEWLSSHEANDAVSQKIQKIQSMEAMGAKVLVVNADVADFDQMTTGIDQAQEQFGPIQGVIHAAGIAPGGLMLLKKPEVAASVMAPKVKGTLLLDKLLGSNNLDFCVLCSSVSAIFGDFGQVDYSAANAFLDAYALQRPPQRKIISINWNMWRDVGMGANIKVPTHLQKRRERELKLGIGPEDGKEAFARILEGSFPQVIVSPGELGITGYKEAESDEVELAAKVSPTMSKRPRPNLSTGYVNPVNSRERAIAEMWQDLLAIDRVGINDNFFELGGNSALVPSVISRIRNAYAVTLSSAGVIENPTVHLLSEGIGEGRWDGALLDASRSRGQRRREARESR
jgi:NADP-dependent 3-hydroxy acid dehydrogenase YdfG